MTINLLNIGCFKNLVDSERLMRVLDDAGFNVQFGNLRGSADIGIINTCGFIGEAEDESLTAIRKYAAYKAEGNLGELWIMGCYSEKFGQKLYSLVPEIDRIFGNFDWEDMPRALGLSLSVGMKRFLTTPSHYAFVKISEGCNQPCSYCIKPILNGPLKSVPIEDVLQECHWLVSQGVKEIQLVAQNLTAYGQDIYGHKRIADLVSRISDMAGIEWIRLHYGYPSGFPFDLLDVIRDRDNVCNYLDMAIQHSETKMLKLMRRGMTKESLTELIAHIRASVPGIYLRTTVMVGHPSETEEDYENLITFLEQERFERLGVFRYSHQSGSYAAANYIDSITAETKKKRALAIIELQNKIYQEQSISTIGKTDKVIIDQHKDGTYIGRSQYSTPMADPFVMIPDSIDLEIGQFYQVKYTGYSGHNMQAEI